MASIKTKVVRIKLKPPVECSEVKLVGDFTDWQNAAINMTKSSKGKDWTASVRLAPGEHQYRFLVDGNWFTDPSTERMLNNVGSENSVLRVE